MHHNQSMWFAYETFAVKTCFGGMVLLINKINLGHMVILENQPIRPLRVA
jgi:hypothetical protein